MAVRRGNAVEHGGETVTVTVDDLEDRFYVADDGPEIQSGELDRVFESGYSTSDAGSGMGLRIVEQIAAARGWDVTAGTSDDGGARFEIRGIERTAEQRWPLQLSSAVRLESARIDTVLRPRLLAGVCTATPTAR